MANKNKIAILGENKNISYYEIILKSLIKQSFHLLCKMWAQKEVAGLVIHGFQLRTGFNFVTACWKMQQREGDNCLTIPRFYIHKTIIPVNIVIILFFKGCSRSLIAYEL